MREGADVAKRGASFALALPLSIGPEDPVGRGRTYPIEDVQVGEVVLLEALCHVAEGLEIVVAAHASKDACHGPQHGTNEAGR